MRTIHFPEWPHVLAQAQLPDHLQHSFEITIRWFWRGRLRGQSRISIPLENPIFPEMGR